jgi:aldose 1-epimerase
MTIDGGTSPWGRMSFDVVMHTENSITFVVFDFRMNGFPGTVCSSLTHTVTPYEWRIAYGVTPTQTKTPINLSNQVFWNLDGFARESVKAVTDHTLHLPFSGLRLAVDQDGIPTGDISGNKKNSTYDFWSAPRPLGAGLSKANAGYSDTFLIGRSQPWDWNTQPVASLASPHSGIKLDLYTEQEALHVLTWNEEDGEHALCVTSLSRLLADNICIGSIKLKQGQGKGNVPQYAAVSLQMQDWMDAVNHPEWQRDSKIFWDTDQLYVTHSKYKFSVEQNPPCG